MVVMVHFFFSFFCTFPPKKARFLSFYRHNWNITLRTICYKFQPQAEERINNHIASVNIQSHKNISSQIKKKPQTIVSHSVSRDTCAKCLIIIYCQPSVTDPLGAETLNISRFGVAGSCLTMWRFAPLETRTCVKLKDWTGRRSVSFSLFFAPLFFPELFQINPHFKQSHAL